MKLYHAFRNIISAVPLENRPKILLLSPYLYFFFFIVCLFVCAIDHGVNEKEPTDEQYREQVCEDQYREPEPEGQYLEQDFSEGFVNGKFNLIL